MGGGLDIYGEEGKREKMRTKLERMAMGYEKKLGKGKGNERSKKC